MDLSGKTVLVVGMARTGLAAARTLSALGAKVICNDRRPEADFPGIWAQIGVPVENGLGLPPGAFLPKADLVVLSPSVPAALPALQPFYQAGIPVLGEIELSYRLCKGKVLAISGTNGKTTTTTLTGEILRCAGEATHVVGNIGNPFIAEAAQGGESDWFVTEISSYQLETAETFRPYAAALLNITPDHLDRHGNMEGYIQTKYKLFANQQPGDWAVLNADEPLAAAAPVRANKLLVSLTKEPEQGLFLKDGIVCYRMGNKEAQLLPAADIRIKGRHNLQNAMAAAGLALAAGIKEQTICKVLREFPGVEHRIEQVRTVSGITFYNDSKGTNPDSTIKAIQTMEAPTILILGGYDKHGEFDELIAAYTPNITHTVVLGATREKIAAALTRAGIADFTCANSFDEAVHTAYQYAKQGYNVLLSPACASFDMFRDYEERGRIFKEIVRALKPKT